MSLYAYNKEVQAQQKRDPRSYSSIRTQQEKLESEVGEKLFGNTNRLEDDEAFKLMCAQLGNDALAKAAGQAGFELLDHYANAQQTLEARKKEGGQPAGEKAKEEVREEEIELSSDDSIHL